MKKIKALINLGLLGFWRIKSLLENLTKIRTQIITLIIEKIFNTSKKKLKDLRILCWIKFRAKMKKSTPIKKLLHTPLKKKTRETLAIALNNLKILPLSLLIKMIKQKPDKSLSPDKTINIELI